MIIVSHPTGNANVRAALQGFASATFLTSFYTGIASFQGGMLDTLGGIGPLSEIRRRRFDKSIQLYTQTIPWLEAGRMLASKAGFSSLVKHETGVVSVDAVFRHQD